ncbi:MAG: hypothetical protein OEV41_05030 [Gammaproteobacteria bacterium]|nr:hypothetical protein [Gammaproteobacteria bacterium]
MQHTVDILGITIAEPTTMVTDFAITIVALWLGARLGRSGPRRTAQRLWAAGFVLIGLGALLGGISHGFARYLGETQYFWIWKATVYSVGLSMLFAVAGTIAGTRLRYGTRTLLHVLNAAAFLVYAYWMIAHSDFVYVIYHYVPAMISIALIQAIASRGRAESARWLIGGVLVTLAGAAIQQSGFTIHRHFNNNDLYHVIQIVGLYLLYRGARLLGRSDGFE